MAKKKKEEKVDEKKIEIKKENATKKMVLPKSWDEFRSTGLLLFINQILHLFGWAIVLQIDDTDNKVSAVYPARCKFRGFKDSLVSKSYANITTFMKENMDDLIEETTYEE